MLQTDVTHQLIRRCCCRVWVCKKSWLTIPVVFSLGFFMMMPTCSLTSRINRSATPGWVCSTVQQMWMLWKRRLRVCFFKSFIKATNLPHSPFLVQCVPGRILQRVQIPALWRQCIRQTENIKNIWAYCHHGHQRISKHKYSLYLADSVSRKKEECVLVVIR